MCGSFSISITSNNIETLFSLKVDAITLKKKLAFCVRKHNKGETIFSNELDKYIDEEILEYQNRLEELIQYNLLARCGEKTYISHNEFKNIKKLYYEIAHLIHPDLHPEYKDDEEILELWNNAVDAYKNNEYKHLVEIYDSIIIKVKSSDIYIENIDIKIDTIKEEIQNIKENDPYKYKFILKTNINLYKNYKQI